MSDDDKKVHAGTRVLMEGMEEYEKKQEENKESLRYVIENGKSEDVITLISFFISQYENRDSAPVAQAIAEILKPVLELKLESRPVNRKGDVARVLKLSKWGRKDGHFAKQGALHALLLVDHLGKEPKEAFKDAAKWAFEHYNDDGPHKYKKKYEPVEAIEKQYYLLKRKISNTTD